METDLKPSYFIWNDPSYRYRRFLFPSDIEGQDCNCRSGYFEIDMDDMSSMESMMSIITRVFMKDGRSLEGLVTSMNINWWTGFKNQSAFHCKLLERMKPCCYLLCHDGSGWWRWCRTKSYEMEIYGKVKINIKNPMAGDCWDQLAIFDSIPYDGPGKMCWSKVLSQQIKKMEYKAMVTLFTKNRTLRPWPRYLLMTRVE